MRIKIINLGLVFLILGALALSQEEKKTKFLGERNPVHVNFKEEIFHVEGCVMLMKNRRTMTLKRAHAQGYKPCEKCILSKESGIISSFIDEKYLGKKFRSKSSIEEFWERNPNLPPNIKEAILNKDILIGMTFDQVRASRGSPHKINKTTTANMIREQWIMHPPEGPRYNDYKSKEYGYIYFVNGKVTSWQSR
jgi:hypothetical protein